MNKSIIYIWLFSLVCVFIQPVRVYDEMPDTIATKFDTNGHPIEYSTKEQLVFWWLGVAIFVNALMFAVGALIMKLAPNALNIPNKQYWLSNDARKKEAQEKLTNGLLLIATVCNILFLVIFYALYHFSMDGKLPFDLTEVLIAYGIIMLGVLFYFISSFRVPPQTNYTPGIR